MSGGPAPLVPPQALTFGRNFGCGVEPDRVPTLMQRNVEIKASLYPTCLTTANLPPMPPPRPPPAPPPPPLTGGTWPDPFDITDSLSSSLTYESGVITVSGAE